MLACTDRHLRYFFRLMSKHIVLYSEMVTTGALIHNSKERFLGYSDVEHPVVLQLGGDNPDDLAKCAEFVEEYGYDEVNMNVGCPSDRVQSGHFGACLMAEPDLVAECVKAMVDSVSIPVTVKTRIGVDDKDSYQYLSSFIEKVANAGCKVFIIHARKAYLSKYSPRENREKIPINYETVYRLKEDFPDLEIIINGDIFSVEDIERHLEYVDGAMIGRLAYQDLYQLSYIDKLYYDADQPIKSRHQLVREFIPYVDEQLADNSFLTLHKISRHLLNLFQGVPGAKAWRRYLSENGVKKGSGVEVLEQALKLVCEE